jgi:hypothetical protein
MEWQLVLTSTEKKQPSTSGRICLDFCRSQWSGCQSNSLLRAGLSFDLRFVSKFAEPFVPIGNDLGESPIGLFLLI